MPTANRVTHNTGKKWFAPAVIGVAVAAFCCIQFQARRTFPTVAVWQVNLEYTTPPGPNRDSLHRDASTIIRRLGGDAFWNRVAQRSHIDRGQFQCRSAKWNHQDFELTIRIAATDAIVANSLLEYLGQEFSNECVRINRALTWPEPVLTIPEPSWWKKYQRPLASLTKAFSK